MDLPENTASIVLKIFKDQNSAKPLVVKAKERSDSGDRGGRSFGGDRGGYRSGGRSSGGSDRGGDRGGRSFGGDRGPRSSSSSRRDY
jgi:hypothetical protein